MTNLEKLEKEIRSKLPRLMELSEGCLINTPYGIAKVNHLSIDEDFKDVVFVCKQLQYRACPVKHITIIGHEIKLNDVLEWLGIKDCNYCQTTDDDLLCITFKSNDYHVAYWDLSKNLLKDQNQQLIYVLNKLIQQ